MSRHIYIDFVESNRHISKVGSLGKTNRSKKFLQSHRGRRHFLAGKLDEKIASFSMDLAREKAWKVAKEFAPLQIQTLREDYISIHDQRVASFGKKLVHPGILLHFFILTLRILERGNIQKKIRILKGPADETGHIGHRT